jgi:hypothetical protein
MGFDISLYPKYKNKIDNIASKFERLSKVCFANYELFDVTKCSSEKCNIFDFSKFFRYFPILKNRESLLAHYLLTLVNDKAMLVNSKIDEKSKNIIDGYFNDILVKTMEDYLNVMMEAKEFIDEYSELYDDILNENNIKDDEAISNAFLINTRKRYLGYEEALRFELLEQYQNGLISSKQCHDIINIAIESGCNSYLDLIIFEEGYFYIVMEENGKYHYELKLYDKELAHANLSLKVDGENIKCACYMEEEYLILKSNSYNLKDIKNYNDIKYVSLYKDAIDVVLHPLGLETKKYYKEREE